MAGDERNWPSPDDEQRDHHESAGRCSERYAYRRRQRQLCIQQTVFYVTMVTCRHHFFKVEFILCARESYFSCYKKRFVA